MAYMLPHLHSAWEVDQAILAEDSKIVVDTSKKIIRFGITENVECMKMDEALLGICDDIESIACVFLVDIQKVPDFNVMYELYDPVTTMFFYRNKHMMIDLGTGDNNKINWALTDRQELLNIIEVIYKGARKGTPPLTPRQGPRRVTQRLLNQIQVLTKAASAQIAEKFPK
jgi:DIM1 family U5 snRNP protein